MGFKESTPIVLGEQRSIRGKLAEPADDSRRLLLEFVLVLAHVADHTIPRDPAILKKRALLEELLERWSHE